MTCEDLEKDYDWREAFKYGDEPTVPPSTVPRPELAFTIADVQRVIAFSEGDNDELDWLIVVKLRRKPYPYAMLVAGCCYTGWG